MKIFITGGTGYIGYPLALKLAEQGNSVHLLARNPKSAFVPRHPCIQVFKGDIQDRDSIATAIKGCKKVFHVAASVKLWAKNSDEIFTTNVDGTANVLEAAREESVSRVVFTSSCGVIGPCLKEPMTENDPRTIGFTLDYDLSKKMAENIVQQYVLQGLDVVIVSPSKIHGPGHFSHKLTLNAVIDRYLKKRIGITPSPGTYRTCFAYIEDIVNGHLLAMENGRAGEKYILGGINISYLEFFNAIHKVSSIKGHIMQLSRNTIKGWALLQMINYAITGRPPFFTAGAIDHFFGNYCFSSEKAIDQIGYKITPLEVALEKTIHYLNQPQHVT